jgi:Histidine kinase-like ATPase domain
MTSAAPQPQGSPAAGIATGTRPAAAPGWFAPASRCSTQTAGRRDQGLWTQLTAARHPFVMYLPDREPAHVRHARHGVRTRLDAWDLGEHADVGELIVSELVTNAVCHGEGPIWMQLTVTSGDLRVEVHDHGAGRPVGKRTAGDDECGRGLELLDGLIELHGGERGVINDQAGHGKTVYVVLSLEATPAGPR